jgi:hypothetical protein
MTISCKFELPLSGPQIEISLRLQFRDPDHAAPVRSDEAGQQILQRNMLRFHGVTAGGESTPASKNRLTRRLMSGLADAA